MRRSNGTSSSWSTRPVALKTRDWATSAPHWIGASPRATIGLAMAGKAKAFMSGRGYVIPEDIRSVAMSVLRHRIGLTFEAEAEDISQEQIVEILVRSRSPTWKPRN